MMCNPEQTMLGHVRKRVRIVAFPTDGVRVL